MALPEYDEARAQLKQRMLQADTQAADAIQRKFAQLGSNPELQAKITEVNRQNLGQQQDMAMNDIRSNELAAQRKIDLSNQQRDLVASEQEAKNQFATSERMKGQDFAASQQNLEQAFNKNIKEQELAFDNDKFQQNLNFNKSKFDQQFALDKDISEFNKYIASEEMKRRNPALYNQLFGPGHDPAMDTAASQIAESLQGMVGVDPLGGLLGGQLSGPAIGGFGGLAMGGQGFSGIGALGYI